MLLRIWKWQYRRQTFRYFKQSLTKKHHFNRSHIQYIIQFILLLFLKGSIGEARFNKIDAVLQRSHLNRLNLNIIIDGQHHICQIQYRLPIATPYIAKEIMDIIFICTDMYICLFVFCYLSILTNFTITQDHYSVVVILNSDVFLCLLQHQAWETVEYTVFLLFIAVIQSISIVCL